MKQPTTLDQQTTIADLRAAVHRFVAARDWYRYHTPKNLVMSIAIEVSELMEHFQWVDTQASAQQMKPNEQNADLRFQVADELADVLIYALSFANSCDIDVSQAILAKLARNEERFPVEHELNKLREVNKLAVAQE